MSIKLLSVNLIFLSSLWKLPQKKTKKVPNAAIFGNILALSDGWLYSKNLKEKLQARSQGLPIYAMMSYLIRAFV